MTLFPAEVLLIIVALGLFLYDAAVLLHVNEGLLVPGGQGRWLVRFGSRNLGLGGRELWLPPPLLLHRPAFRLLWDPRPAAAEDRDAWEARRRLFRPAGPLVWLMALALFVLLPLGLFTRLGDRMVLLALALLYLAIFCFLAWAGLKRREVGLPGRRLAALAFELLVCPPFALNAVRRLSAGMAVRGDLMATACALQRPEDWRATRTELLGRLEEQIDAEGDDSERGALLKGSRQKLLDQAPCRG
jgi:hypothetical protein